ncbi:hypothetical protein V7139_04845 [Neobacillus drentensis]
MKIRQIKISDAERFVHLIIAMGGNARRNNFYNARMKFNKAYF